MATSIQDFVDTIAIKASIDPAAAETAVGTILSAIQQEGDATKVSQLFNQIPGAAELAQKHPVVVGAGGGVLGSLSGVASKMIGQDAGIVVAAIGQIEETNLTMQQIKNIGSALLSYFKETILLWRRRSSTPSRVYATASAAKPVRLLAGRNRARLSLPRARWFSCCTSSFPQHLLRIGANIHPTGRA